MQSAFDEHKSRVALVNMPFASSRRPSIQLGLLQAILAERGIHATSIYFNLEFGAFLGWESYESLCHARDILLGEWLFARAAFLDQAPAPHSFLEHYAEDIEAVCTELGCDVDYLLNLRERELPAFIDQCLEEVDWTSYDVVGFSSIFEQNCAALALARRLKERFPSLVIVFGGANFEDEMGLEYVRALPFIDYAVIGEGDEVFPQLLERLAEGGDAGALMGVASRGSDGEMRFMGRAPQVSNLDALPEPDYTEYFESAARLGLPPLVRGQVVALPVETARGCWWGAKHHCTFCGLNALGMKFRSKSPARVLAGLDELASRHDTYAFLSVDNILDQRYIVDVFEPLARQRKDYTFFFEVKANLTRDSLRKLMQGGLRILQPGIESLNTRLLQLMRKGSTALLNVRFLKWARYYDLVVAWNLLLGFPGERREDYRQQVAIMRLISHLCPPAYVGRIRLDRFSPNFTDSQQMGFFELRPIPAYENTYPSLLDHDAIAYFFAYDAPEALPDSDYREVKESVREWQRAWEVSNPPFLLFQRGAGRLTITDGRTETPPRVFSFGELEAMIYEACTPTAHSVSSLLRLLRNEHGLDESPATLEQALAQFCDLGLMLEEEGQFLGLAVPVNTNW
ncbi:MAG TPA: RiPP maturation radical SAM C-methyltransferase [Pyrinomonadaceae bacterium]